MPTEPQVRFYLGANSPAGFYSLYDELIDPLEAKSIFILKGGAGCGKSTFMRQVARQAEEKGLPVEYIPCSGDPDSLDAVILPGQKSAIVDGTAPHVVEPRYPGVVDRYVNLGDCYDYKALAGKREEIVAAMTGYKGCYAQAYRCLSAAEEVTKNLRSVLETPEMREKMGKRARGILKREVRRREGGTGRVTRRFLSAVTHKGPLCEYGTVEKLCKRVYELDDPWGLAHGLLCPLLRGAVAAGWDAIACPSPMEPGRLEHLLLPQLSLGFVTSGPQLRWDRHAYRRLHLDAMADREVLKRERGRLRFGRKIVQALQEEAVASLAQAKEMHDKLEGIYNPFVDFGSVRRLADQAAAELLGPV